MNRDVKKLIDTIGILVKNVYAEELANSNKGDAGDVFDATVDKASSILKKYVKGTDIEDIVREIIESILNGDDVAKLLDIYYSAVDTDELSEMLDKLKSDKHIKLEEETISSGNLGGYLHAGGGAAGNAFYDPDLNEKTRPKNPVADMYNESREIMKKLIKAVIEGKMYLDD